MNVKKAVALSLSCCLLGQSALVAAPKGPSTLKEYQARAKANIKTAPWIKEESKWVMMAGGLPITTVLANQITELRRLNAEKDAIIEQLRGELAAQQKVAATELEKRLAEFGYWEKALEDLVFDESYTPMKEIEGEMTAMAKDYIQFFDRFKRIQRHREKTLLKRYDWSKASTLADEEAEAWMDREEKAFFQELIKRHEWFSKLSNEERATFHEIFLDYSRFGYSSEAFYERCDWLWKKSFNNYGLAVKRLLAFSRGFMKSMARNPKTYLIGGIFLLAAFSHQNAKAQRTSNRIINNPALFINATPEELAQLEKDKETREACIEVSNTIYLLSAMTQEELAPYKAVFQKQQRSQRLNHSRGRGLAH